MNARICSVIQPTLSIGRYKDSFKEEVSGLARLKDDNISRLLGACLDDEPVCGIREYAELGDLCQFLQDHVAETATPIMNAVSTLR